MAAARVMAAEGPMCASRVGVRGGAAASTRGLVCVAMGSPVSTRSARMPVIARWPRAAAGVQFNTAHPRGVSSKAAATEADTEENTEGKVAPKWRAAVDFKFIRDNAELVQSNAVARKAVVDVAQVVTLYDQWLAVKSTADDMRASRNASAAKMKGKLEQAQRDELIAEGKRLKEEVAVIEQQQSELEEAMYQEGQRVPNLTHPDVPSGGEENATLRAMIGTMPEFGFAIKDHLELGESLGLLDFERAAEVSGAKFYYLKGMGAMLELALVNWAMQKVFARGFTPHMTPDLVRSSVLEKCGFQPRMANTQTYSIENTDLCLTGTAEIPLGGLFMDGVVDEKELPIRVCAFGHCFRTEAGAAGAASKGLYRVHQFSKVEMFVLATPEQSDAMHEELISLEEEMFAELGLHFKTLDMPTEDLGAPAYRKFDVECWMPGMQRYGEISSASNCTDYQARRLNIRYRPAAMVEDKNGKKKKAPLQFVHTLNATACAVPRMIIAILETFQQEDGSVVVPEVLRPFLGGVDVLRP